MATLRRVNPDDEQTADKCYSNRMTFKRFTCVSMWNSCLRPFNLMVIVTLHRGFKSYYKSEIKGEQMEHDIHFLSRDDFGNLQAGMPSKNYHSGPECPSKTISGPECLPKTITPGRNARQKLLSGRNANEKLSGP